MAEKITPKQIKLIHIAKAQLGLSDDDYRELIVSIFPDAWGGSCKELSYDQASKFIDRFKEMGFQIKGKPRNRRLQRPERQKKSGRKVEKLVTPDQEAKITALAGHIQWRAWNGLARLNLKLIGREHPVTSFEAQKIIEALKGMRNNRMYEAYQLGVSFGELMEEYGIEDVTEQERILESFKRKERKMS